MRFLAKKSLWRRLSTFFDPAHREDITQTFRLFKAQLRLSLTSSLQYRADYLLTILSVAISAGVEIALWRLVLQSRGQVRGFGLDNLIIYLIVANITAMFSVNWESVLTLSEEVRSGRVSRHLSRPLSLFIVATGDWLAGKIPVFIGSIAVFAALGFIVPHLFHPSVADIAMYLSLLSFAIWACAEIYFLIILTSFWIAENEGIAIAFNILRWAFVGSAFPLSFYPEWVAHILDATPLPYLVYYPSMALLSRLAPARFFIRLVSIFAMALVLTSLRRFFWKLAEHRLQTVGG
jgi:ABC-2 type transport system permease protein